MSAAARAARVVRSGPGRLVILLAGLLGVAIVISLLDKPLRAAGLSRDWASAALTLIALPAALLTYRGLVRLLERRAASEVAGPGILVELGAGLVLGAALFGAVLGVIALLGGYAVDGAGDAGALVPLVAMGASSGVLEELIARGVLLRVLEEWLGSLGALAVSSAIFGALHLGNQHATAWSAVAIAVEAGTLLGATYLLTRRLWLAMGVHAAWNFTQAACGVAVSGMELPGLLRGRLHGPAWLTGGAFGAEASVVAVVICTSAATLVLGKAFRRHGAVAPSWRRRASRDRLVDAAPPA